MSGRADRQNRRGPPRVQHPGMGLQTALRGLVTGRAPDRRAARPGPRGPIPAAGFRRHGRSRPHNRVPGRARRGGAVRSSSRRRRTSVQLSPASWRQLVGEPGRMRVSAVYVDARTELAHRRLLAAGQSDIDYRLAEELLRLLSAALRAAAQRTPMHDACGPFDRRLVERARAAIHDGHPAAGGLFGLAALVGASPYRLSRAFPRELGVSMTKYRNRVRVGRALDQLDRDDSSLADVAASLDFADQAASHPYGARSRRPDACRAAASDDGTAERLDSWPCPLDLEKKTTPTTRPVCRWCSRSGRRTSRSSTSTR